MFHFHSLTTHLLDGAEKFLLMLQKKIFLQRSLICFFSTKRMEFQSVQFLHKVQEYDDVFSYFFQKNSIEYLAGQYSHILLGYPSFLIDSFPILIYLQNLFKISLNLDNPLQNHFKIFKILFKTSTNLILPFLLLYLHLSILSL